VSQAATLLWSGALHLLLIAAPGVAAVFVAVNRKVRDVPTLLGIGLAVSGVSALTAFFAYFAFHVVGVGFSYAVLIGSVLVVPWAWQGIKGRAPWRELATPIVLWWLAAFFVLFLGFLHGGVGKQPLEPVIVSTTRFSRPLAVDNYLPLYFSKWLYSHGHAAAAPPIGEWLSSDRPPLQMGYVLLQRPFAWDSNGLQYQVLGVALQQLWVVGLWALLLAVRVRPRTRTLMVVAGLVSDVVILHGFYVWPKLIAVGFLLASAALLLTDRWRGTRGSLGMGALVASLWALALLCHTSSVFVIVPLAMLALLRRPTWQWVAAVIAVGIVLLAPWSAYQRYFDPPGNRIVKWNVAGVVPIDNRSVGQALSDSYQQLGWSGWLENKARNVNAITGGAHGLTDFGHGLRLMVTGHVSEAIRVFRLQRYNALVYSLGLFVLTPFLVLWILARRRRRDQRDWRFALQSLLLVTVSCAVWILVLFGSTASPTAIWLGSLAVPVLALAGCIAAIASATPTLATTLVAHNALTVLALYTPILDPLPDTRFSYVAAAATLGSLVGYIAVAAISEHSTLATAAMPASTKRLTDSGGAVK
jgi:hypothetical protein